MNNRFYRSRWHWLLLGTVMLALAGAWLSSEAAACGVARQAISK